jgi:signal transduction histidine kinase
MGTIKDNVTHQSLFTGVFDREYGLSDLLPVKHLKVILNPLKELFYIEILTRNGNSYFNLQEKRTQAVNHWIQTFFTDHIPKILPTGFWQEHKVIFTLQHEKENIGYLFVTIEDEKKSFSTCFKYIGEMVAVVLNQMIQLNCQVLMTSGLQCQVVEDSYAQLQDRAQRLAQSEHKYRQLAESLEIEVQRKTETIQKALMKMAQQEKMASVGQLAAGVAHEINNPMGFIISNLNTLKNYRQDLHSFFQTHRYLASKSLSNSLEKFSSNWQKLYEKFEIEYLLSDFEDIIAESIEGAERIKKIVMDLKEFSQPGLHNAVLTDLNQLIRTVLNVSRAHIGELIQIKTDLSPLPRILCIPQQINQVILNLLFNAFQSMRGKGQILITTKTVNDQVEMIIQDSGCGIAQDDLSKIFDPFFTTREVGSGKGLGLTFAYDVIQKHQGCIKVQSEVNCGSSFTICIPSIGK